jgi:K+ transporter
MLLDTTLFSLVTLIAWEWHLAFVAAFWLIFTFITGAFLSSTLEKVPKGTWFRCARAACVLWMTTWVFNLFNCNLNVAHLVRLITTPFLSSPPAA